MPVEKKEKTKRKHEEAFKEIEIDVNLPEPLSKKELRKKKKTGLTATPAEPQGSTEEKPLAQKHKDTKRKSEGAKSKSKTEFGVWIGNLSFDLKKDDVRKLLTTKSAARADGSDPDLQIKEDEIVRVHMPKNPGGQNKGFAYVDFISPKALQNAIALSETPFGGRKVLIKDAKEFTTPGGDNKSTRPDKKPLNATRILFIGNLPFETKSALLEEIFTIPSQQAADQEDQDRSKSTELIKPTRVRMATFQDTGKCKGFAFIDYSTSDDAAKVLSKVGTRINVLGRRDVKVEFGEDRSFRWKAKLDAAPDIRKTSNEAKKITPEHKDDQQHSSHKDSDSVKVPSDSYRAPVRRKKPTSRETPGMALANAQRAKVSIVPSEGKKIVFSE